MNKVTLRNYDEHNGYHLIFVEHENHTDGRGMWIGIPIKKDKNKPYFKCNMDEHGYGVNDTDVVEYEKKRAKVALMLKIDELK